MSNIKFFTKSFAFIPVALTIFLFFSSCSKNIVEIPKGVLSKEELVPVLVDLQLAQAVGTTMLLTDSTRFSMNDYSEYIFKMHHVSKAEYDSSISFYTQHPELMDAMYEEVVSELSKKQSEVGRK